MASAGSDPSLESASKSFDDDDRHDLELTHELRLRRWARQNFVPPVQRLDSWHEVIQDEMSARDRELAEVVIPRILILRDEPLRRVPRPRRRSA